jgi:hypothetical protein
MWTILGFQLCSVALPVWVAGGEQLPKVMTLDSSGVAPLCDMALKLKRQCFPIHRGSGATYLNLAALLNKEGTGILQMLLPLEMEIIRESEEQLSYWRKNGMDIMQIEQYYRLLDEKILEHYHNIFGL